MKGVTAQCMQYPVSFMSAAVILHVCTFINNNTSSLVELTNEDYRSTRMLAC